MSGSAGREPVDGAAQPVGEVDLAAEPDGLGEQAPVGLGETDVAGTRVGVDPLGRDAEDALEVTEQVEQRRLDDPGSLDDAASVARRWALERGAERVVVAHGDLPFADDLEHLAAPGSARIALTRPR